MSESSEITGPLVKMIRQMGIFCERMNSGKVKVRGGWMQLHSAGTADILAFPRGRVVWLETKDVAKDYHKEQREAQEAFRERVIALGHECYTIRTIDEGVAVLRSNPAPQARQPLPDERMPKSTGKRKQLINQPDAEYYNHDHADELSKWCWQWNLR